MQQLKNRRPHVTGDCSALAHTVPDAPKRQIRIWKRYGSPNMPFSFQISQILTNLASNSQFRPEINPEPEIKPKLIEKQGNKPISFQKKNPFQFLLSNFIQN